MLHIFYLGFGINSSSVLDQILDHIRLPCPRCHVERRLPPLEHTHTHNKEGLKVIPRVGLVLQILLSARERRRRERETPSLSTPSSP